MWYLRIFPILRRLRLVSHTSWHTPKQRSTSGNKFRNPPSRGQGWDSAGDESFLNIASLVYSSQPALPRLFILTCCLSTSAWRSWGKQQTSTSLHVETRLGTPKYSHLLEEALGPQSPWNLPSPSKLRKQDPVPWIQFQVLNQSTKISSTLQALC